MCEAPSTWRASTCAIVWRSFIWAYSGLMAAPGTPKACVMPSFSITSTAAIAAFILAMSLSPDRWSKDDADGAGNRLVMEHGS